jgi:hypothetical protein
VCNYEPEKTSSPQTIPGACAMRPQILFDHLLRIWVPSPSAAVAARRLGISCRTLYYRLEKASVTELRDAFVIVYSICQAAANGVPWLR